MSTIKVSNIRIASESVSRPVTGVAAAFMWYDMVANTIGSSSLNTSSVTDISAGNALENFTNSMDSATYSQVVCGVNLPQSYTLCVSGPLTVSAAQAISFNKTMTTLTDSNSLSASIHGELA